MISKSIFSPDIMKQRESHEREEEMEKDQLQQTFFYLVLYFYSSQHFIYLSIASHLSCRDDVKTIFGVFIKVHQEILH